MPDEPEPEDETHAAGLGRDNVPMPLGNQQALPRDRFVMEWTRMEQGVMLDLQSYNALIWTCLESNDVTNACKVIFNMYNQRVETNCAIRYTCLKVRDACEDIRRQGALPRVVPSHLNALMNVILGRP